MIVLEPQEQMNACAIGYCADGPSLIYDYEKLVEHFMGEGMTDEEAMEWVDFNILGAYFGEGNPVIVNVLSSWDEKLPSENVTP